MLDGSHANDRRRSLAHVQPQPRAAMEISLITGISLDSTLWQLRQLEIRGQVKHITDEAGVMRWERLPENGWEEKPPL